MIVWQEDITQTDHQHITTARYDRDIAKCCNWSCGWNGGCGPSLHRYPSCAQLNPQAAASSESRAHWQRRRQRGDIRAAGVQSRGNAMQRVSGTGDRDSSTSFV